MKTRALFFEVFVAMSLLQRINATNRKLTCGFVIGHSAEFHAVNSVFNNASRSSNVSVVLKKFNISDPVNLFNQASTIFKSNVITLIEGIEATTPACALSTVTGIPLIRLRHDSGPLGHCEKSIQMSVGYKDYARATLDIVNTFGWKNIVLVYEERHVYKAGFFVAITQKLQLTVNLVQLSEQGQDEEQTAPIQTAMEQVKDFDAEIVVLYLENKNIQLMLQQKPCNHRKTYIWIIQGQVDMPLNLTCYQNSVVALKLSYDDHTVDDLLKLALGNNLSSSVDKHLAAVSFDAVQIINSAASREPCSSINGSDIGPEETKAMLTCLRKIGTWNSTKGAVLSGNILRNMDNPLSQTTLEGRKLRAVVLMDSPFIMRVKNENGGFSFEGYCIDLLNELARNLKFTYELYLSPDGKYGTENEDGTWNGMMNEIVNERADMIVAALTITESREKVVDFSIPFMYYTEDILLKKTSVKEKYDLLQFMNPFDNQVWFATLATLVIISIAVFVINYYSPYGYKDENGRGTSEEFSFFNSVWFALACMLQQGGDNTPKSLSGRILTGCYWFCILIWVSTYTANLAAFFTVKNAEHPINNLEDIVKSSYSVAILDSSSTSEFFKTSGYETHKKIWHKIKSDGTLAKDTAQGVEWVREKEEFAFITDRPFLQDIANNKPCDLQVVPGLSTSKGLALAFQANDPHVNDFTLAILRLHENDFLASLKRKWWESTNKCPVEEETSLSRKRIGLMSMLGVYIVLAVGMIIAFMTLAVEHYWKRKAKQALVDKLQRTKLRSVKIRPGPP
ncbi:glutamate receptor 4-like isoform X2 [Stylophora pistillata]|uniref:glutamate receptor 4-like isoform X2 n=1 Tax=Stylophora pistillata TaxID=50429 RepID=UPI000C03FC71|nr:glutamate receptor 4-like isoform X2 [Stylophora pistillata]